jgi:uroporphyrin-III C-methyltransferase
MNSRADVDLLQARAVPRPRCTLVGAGPGDPELLTIKALRAIRRATLLLVDDLVGPELLAFALKGLRRQPRIVQVGKRGGCASTPQAFIERLMATQALAGERVVRLKGGDPFIFGRGGEEAEHLRALGVEVDVVAGITSGLAAAHALSVPLTHRDHAHGVMFITGHAREHGAPLDWGVIGAAAAQGLTLVIYMGVAQMASLQDGLLRQLGADTPAAVVQHASLPTQRQLVTTLGGLCVDMRREGLGSPAIIVVGDVLKGIAAAMQPASPAAPATSDVSLDVVRACA